MIEAGLPFNEAQRLAVLRRYQVLDTEAEQAFDDLTLIAAKICRTPVALVSLVDADRQWFKSKVGLDASETPRRLAFCAHAILEPLQVMIVPDAYEDERFADNPLVTSDPHVRFYAGAPLVAPGGEALGTLCVIDHQPHRLEKKDVEALRALARQVVSQLELRRKNAELDEAKQAAERANKAKGTFLAQMSHELRTPLNSVIGFANLLEKNKSGLLGASELEYADRISSNGRHLLHLINSILDLSKIEAEKVEIESDATDVLEIVEECIRQIEAQAQDRGIDLTFDIAPGMLPLVTDREKLKQILINLIGNAIKFTPEGSVTVRVECSDSGTPLSLEVADTGIGMKREDLENIFQPFRQADSGTSRQFSGSGLGLAISRSLAKAMGHEIEVESEPGRGSVFRIVFGAVEREEPKTEDTIHFDSTLIQRLGQMGKGEVVHSLLRSFLDLVPGRLDEIHRHLKQESPPVEVASLLHVLKGTGLQLGARRFGELCSESEQDALDGDLAAVEARMDSIEGEFQRVHERIDEILAEHDAS